MEGFPEVYDSAARADGLQSFAALYLIVDFVILAFAGPIEAEHGRCQM
jgi:hypothetical protein